MPSVLTFRLNPEETVSLPPYPGRALHALFYQWLAIGDYSLAVRTHDQDGPRPFTVSPLYRVDGQPTLRLTLLDDTLWPALSQGISLTPTTEVMGQPLTLPADGPQVQHRSYADLVANAGAETRIRLRFLSPTSFRSREMHYPLPIPPSSTSPGSTAGTSSRPRRPASTSRCWTSWRRTWRWGATTCARRWWTWGATGRWWGS